MNGHARVAKLAFFVLAALTWSMLGAPACSGDDNPSPTTSSSSSSSGGTTSGKGGEGTGGTGVGGNGTGGATGGTGGTGGVVNCDGPNGCYSCAPKKNEEFLNACTSAQCTPFDNAARLPLYNGGNLPPLP